MLTANQSVRVFPVHDSGEGDYAFDIESRCQHCKSYVPFHARFCVECGYKVSDNYSQAKDQSWIGIIIPVNGSPNKFLVC